MPTMEMFQQPELLARPAYEASPPLRCLVQNLLSTCRRCRRLRRKCDTLLPNCGLCQRAGAECTLYDHALQQTFPRAYVPTRSTGELLLTSR
jgi:hypothetical protein